MQEIHKFLNRLHLFNRQSEHMLSVNWGKTFVTIVYVQKELSKTKLLAYDVFKSSHPPGSQTDQDAVSFIKKFLSDHQINQKKVVLTISNQDEWISKHVALPPLPPKEILNAIKWNLQDEHKINLENTSIQWNMLNEFVDEDGNKKNRYFVLGVKDEIINRYTNLLSKASLIPVRINHRMVNYIDSLEVLSAPSSMAAVLSMGYQDTLLGFYIGRKLYYVRAIPTSLERIIQTIIERTSPGLRGNEQQFQMVKDILSEYGILQDQDADVNVEGYKVKSFTPLIRPYLELLVRELKMSLDYFRSTFDKEIPRTLYTTGFGGGIKNLDQYIKQELKIDVKTFPIPSQLEVSVIADQAKKINIQHQLLNALCATLSDSAAYNFSRYNPFFIAADFIQRIPLSIVTGACLILTLVLWIVPSMQIQALKSNIKNSGTMLTELREIKSIHHQISQRENFINEIFLNQAPITSVLLKISEFFPRFAILDSFDFDQSSSDLVLKGHFELNDKSVQASLIEFIKNLEQTKLFQEVNLAVVNQSQYSQDFEIRCVFPHEEKSK